jgi:DNA repair exonuclease SbcCD ATPase subunit
MLDLPQVLHFDSNMKCSVMEFGRTTGYGNLSAGEKRRANLSLSYAFRDLVTLRHGGLNVLLMDEIDGGSLDAPAGNSIIKSVFEVCGTDTIWVITHNDLIAQRITNEITVAKECGFSTIRN